MRKILCLAVWLGAFTNLFATIGWQVFEADGITPFTGRELMVGERLVLICHSSTSILDDLWGGEISLTGNNRNLGQLAARGPYTSYDWQGSHLPAAGDFAEVNNRNTSQVQGFQVFTDWEPMAGDWFILDYKATAAGDPNIACSEIVGPTSVFLQNIVIHQVPTRDFDHDNLINWIDWAILQQNWGAELCQNPGWCVGTDLNRDSRVDILDLQMFVGYWLYHIAP